MSGYDICDYSEVVWLTCNIEYGGVCGSAPPTAAPSSSMPTTSVPTASPLSSTPTWAPTTSSPTPVRSEIFPIVDRRQCDSQRAPTSSAPTSAPTAYTYDICYEECFCSPPSFDGLMVSSDSECEIDSNGCVTDGPGHYGNDERCTIDVLRSGIVSSNGTFNTESGYDYLDIDGARYQGTIGPNMVPVSAGSTFSWRSDWSQIRSGWTICLMTAGASLPAKTTQQCSVECQNVPRRTSPPSTNNNAGDSSGTNGPSTNNNAGDAEDDSDATGTIVGIVVALIGLIAIIAGIIWYKNKAALVSSVAAPGTVVASTSPAPRTAENPVYDAGEGYLDVVGNESAASL